MAVNKELAVFVKSLDDDAFYVRCEKAIEEAVGTGQHTVAIDFDWWGVGLKKRVTEGGAFMLFSGKHGVLSKRIGAVLDRLEARFKKPGLKFSAMHNAGVNCCIKERTPVGAAVSVDTK